MRIAVVGAGPSAWETLDELKALVAEGIDVASVNHSHDWLVKRGIKPKFCVMPESFHIHKIQNLIPECTYLVRKDIHPETWETVKNAPLVEKYPKQVNTVLTGEPGMPVVNVLYSHGYTEFDLFGFDGSMPDNGPTHIDGRHERSERLIRYCVVGDRMFKSNKIWRHQSRAAIKLLLDNRVRLNIHGDGLLANIAKHIDEITPEDPAENAPYRQGVEIYFLVRGDKYSLMHRLATEAEAQSYLSKRKKA